MRNVSPPPPAHLTWPPCPPHRTLTSFINRVSKVKRWQQRAAKLLATARSKEGGAPAAGKENEGGGQGESGGAGLRESIEALLAEVEVELKVSGVPEAVELSRLLEVRQGDLCVTGRGGGERTSCFASCLNC